MKGLFSSEEDQSYEYHPVRENIQMEGNKMKEIFDYEENVHPTNQQESKEKEIQSDDVNQLEEKQEVEEEIIIYKENENIENEVEKEEEKNQSSFSESFESDVQTENNNNNNNNEQPNESEEKKDDKEKLHFFDFESLIDLPEKTNIFTPFDNHFTEYQKLINEQNIYLNPLNIILQHSIVDPLELTYKMVCKVCKEMIFSGYKLKKSLNIIKDYYLTGKGDIYEYFIDRVVNEVPV